MKTFSFDSYIYIVSIKSLSHACNNQTTAFPPQSYVISVTMATPQSVEEVYDRIYHSAVTACAGSKAAGTGDYVEIALKDASKKYPFMKGATVKQLLYYITKKQNTEKRRAWQQDRPTEKDFWDAAYEFDPLRQDPGSGPSRLVQLLTPSRFDVLPLGKLYNDIGLGLIPEIGALPESEIRTEDFTTFSPAASDSGAISYSDGHPSEVILPSDMMQPNKDKKLRRFASLGWVVKKSITKGRIIWTTTGHVLVMDMDRGRDHHPWFVLAHEWPNDDNEGSQEDFKHHVPKRVPRNARGAKGVFPGDYNRTPIAKIIFTRDNQPQEDDNTPFLKRFGSDFVFTLERRGGDRPTVESMWGPGLAHVMTWYWDEEKEEEVCYSDDGGEYMRCKRDAGLYYYPRVGSMWTDGE